MTVTSEVVTLTPQMAEEWLAKYNTNNRSIRQARVRRYAKSMAAGRWQVAQPLTFDTNDRMVDGQHRLHAVVLADTPVTFLVVRGVEPEAFDVMDTGINRQIGDITRHRGLPHSTGLSAGVAWWMLLESGFSPSDHHARALLSNEDIADRIEADVDLAEWANSIQHIAKTFASPSAWVAAAYAMNDAGVPRPAFNAFLEAVRYGDNLERDNPILGLRNLILGRERGPHIGPMLFATIITVWNLHIQGLKRRSVTWTPMPVDYVMPKILLPKVELEAVS